MAKEFEFKIDKKLFKMSINTRKGIVKGLAIVGDLTQNEIKKLSAADSFIDRTGKLRTSILRDDVNKPDLSVTVKAHVTDPPYGLFLNDGTKDKSGKVLIKPIKFMEKGLDKVSPRIEKIIVEQLNKIV